MVGITTAGTAKLEGRREACIGLVFIQTELWLANHESRIAQVEIDAMAVARVRIASARSGWIAVENRKQERCVFFVIQFDARPPGVDNG